MAQINGEEFDPYFVSCVTIYPEQVQEEFARTPADIAYWGEMAARAVKAHRLAEFSRKETEATCQLEHRERLSTLTKVTEAMVDSTVKRDPRFKAAVLAEIEAEADMLAARHRYHAVLAKRDMVQSLGALMRSELERVPQARAKMGPQDF